MYLTPVSIVLDELESDEFAVVLAADWVKPDAEFDELTEQFFSAVQAAFGEWFETPVGREVWDSMSEGFCFADLHPEDLEDEILVGLLAKHEIYNFTVQETVFADALESKSMGVEGCAA